MPYILASEKIDEESDEDDQADEISADQKRRKRLSTVTSLVDTLKEYGHAIFIGDDELDYCFDMPVTYSCVKIKLDSDSSIEYDISDTRKNKIETIPIPVRPVAAGNI
jgi:hypothetical protein